uniref:Glycosyltransferase n=1 Tax=Polygala tenuifolia TaxID=355332 RepID=A0A3G3NBG4_9FABA|nr:UDP-glucosyltransferase UGT74B8 [Polygala tenuifolia]
MVANKNQIVHVIVVPYPSQGHINPLLQFAKRLASKGVKSTIATTQYTVKSICAPNVGVEAISDGFDEGGYAQARNVGLFLESFKVNGSKTLSQLIQKFENSSCPVTCIVYDSFLPWALDVAKEHGIYCGAFCTNSASICSIFSRIHQGLLQLPLKVEDGLTLVPGLPPFQHQDLPSFIRLPDSYPDYLAMKLSQFDNLHKADLIFINTFEALEAEAVKDVSKLWPAKLIGPMVPSAYLDGRIKDDKGYGASLWKPLSEECTKWLKTKPSNSVVFVSFGSMVSLTTEQMEEMAWGLKESGMNFLWVVREKEWINLPNDLMDTIKEQGLILTWCNQLEVLAHQATGCFVTHCGWNSTLEGLSLGVPMVGVPQWADQMTNAKFIEEIWEVGVRAKEDSNGVVRKQEIVHCLKEVMQGKRCEFFRQNARKWKESCKQAIDEGGCSDKNIDEFVHHLMHANANANGFINITSVKSS